MAVDVRWQLLWMLFVPRDVLTSSMPQAEAITTPLGELPPDKRNSATSEEHLRIPRELRARVIEDVLEYQEHQSEFMEWRRSRTDEVANFNAWLFPNQAKPAAKKVTLLSMGWTRIAHLHAVLSDPVTFTKSLIQKRLQRHHSNPIEIVPGVALSYATDVCLFIIALVITAAWYYEGLWGVLKVPWRLLESTTIGVAHACLGDSAIEAPYQRGEIPLMEGDGAPNIKNDGVARPAQMMYRSSWEELTRGQRAMLLEIRDPNDPEKDINEKTWEKIREECRRGQWRIPSPTVDWKDITAYQRKCLRAIGFGRRSWDLEDPENLTVNEKMWHDLSSFEKQEAKLAMKNDVNAKMRKDAEDAGQDIDVYVGNKAKDAGYERKDTKTIDVDGYVWDYRVSNIFYTDFEHLEPKAQVHLRNLGFFRDLWKPRQEPWIPKGGARYKRVIGRYLRRRFFQLGVALQVLFLCWVLWELGVFGFFWDNFFVYIVIFFIVAALIVNLATEMLVPNWESHWRVISTYLVVVVSHSKDIWDKVQKLFLAFGRQVCEKCDECQKGPCMYCCPRYRGQHHLECLGIGV
mmetsp:Transcript_6051/g.9775  ORF Transcript_6051/g.9775 Transcript_6051/m.9775 type:complete len:574 (+) Transcript_6051:89-1810(+)